MLAEEGLPSLREVRRMLAEEVLHTIREDAQLE